MPDLRFSLFVLAGLCASFGYCQERRKTQAELDEEEEIRLYQDPEGIKARLGLNEAGYGEACFTHRADCLPLPNDKLTLAEREKEYGFECVGIKRKKILWINELYNHFPREATGADYRDNAFLYGRDFRIGVREKLLTVNEFHRFVAKFAKYLNDIPDEEYRGEYRWELEKVKVTDTSNNDGEPRENVDLYFKAVKIDRNKKKEEKKDDKK